MSEKAELVKKYGKEFGVNRCLAALRLPKGTWHYHMHKRTFEEKYQHLKQPLFRIAEQHSGYGYRRATSELQEDDFQVGKYVVQKLQRCWNLNHIRGITPPKESAFRRILKETQGKLNKVKDLEDIQPFQVVYTDYTELLYNQGSQKAHLIPFLDDSSRAVLGWAIGESGNTKLALKAWGMCKLVFGKFGLKVKGTIVHHDRDSVFTGNRYTHEILINSKAKLSYSENGAKGNTKMESFNGKFKGENYSIFYDCKDMYALGKAVSQRIRYYNLQRRHSSLGNISPMNYLKNLGHAIR